MLRSGQYSVAGDQWPILVYRDETYDPENPWTGLFRNRLLVLVRKGLVVALLSLLLFRRNFPGVQTHIHFPELCRQRTEGYSLWECTNTWHDFSDNSIVGVCCHTGESSPLGDIIIFDKILWNFIQGSICINIVGCLL